MYLILDNVYILEIWRQVVKKPWDNTQGFRLPSEEVETETGSNCGTDQHDQQRTEQGIQNRDQDTPEPISREVGEQMVFHRYLHYPPKGNKPKIALGKLTTIRNPVRATISVIMLFTVPIGRK